MSYTTAPIREPTLWLHYGGALSFIVEGDTPRTLSMNVRLPAFDDLSSYDNLELHPEAEWIELAKFAGSAEFAIDHLNPCALRIR